MNTVPTTTVTVLRGTATDAYDDETDAAAVVAAYKKVPASISEQTPLVQITSEGTPRTIRRFVARIRGDVQLQETDRIKDDRTNEIYIIDVATNLQNPVFTPERRVNLRRVGSTNI